MDKLGNETEPEGGSHDQTFSQDKPDQTVQHSEKRKQTSIMNNSPTGTNEGPMLDMQFFQQAFLGFTQAFANMTQQGVMAGQINPVQVTKYLIPMGLRTRQRSTIFSCDPVLLHTNSRRAFTTFFCR